MSELKGSDTVRDYMICSSCCENTPESFCEGCSKFYCGKCLTLHNQLFKDHVVASTQQKSMEGTCTEHINEKLALFCERHCKQCCQICIALHHRHCTKTSIKQLSKPRTTEIEYIFATIKEIQDKLKLQEIEIDSYLTSFEKSYKSTTKNRSDFYLLIEKAYDQLKKETEQTMVAFRNSLKADVEHCRNIHSYLARLDDALKDAEKKNEDSFALIYRQCAEQLRESEIFLANSIRTNCSFQFVPNKEIERVITNPTSLGRLINHGTKIAVHEKSYHDISEMSDNKGSCCIVSICELHNGQYVVIDSTNMKLKLINHEFKIISSLNVPYTPTCMCRITPCHFVVACETSSLNNVGKPCTIEFYGVFNDQIYQRRKYNLEHYCTSIAHHQGRMYVTSGTALYHYNLDGQKVKKIYENKSGDDTVWKCSVSPSGDKIVVINKKNKCQMLVLVDRKGRGGIFDYSNTELQDPSTVYFTPFGEVLVCGATSNNVILVDVNERRTIATLATQDHGIHAPLSIWYSDGNHKLVIGQRNNNNLIVLTVLI
ncbi:E3 ubiquitin/ISG15 ligase TRIM25-like isoform X2 [Dreissena polymorpha]|uniref:B box-type domain-containing protein n=3 Tax=Dreissena polymorpha TaxID=45954 RepID=A0A9D4K0W3_DREPO|nr:E3 ubiquitin/ISG15 ligase TRIM25-like isoform X2 [Dreissena polymorpha]XP_052284355.1 E3 ubiquitin/ISG15 ligase TRIM25-like isoform X2 [Dreissena polymorpha]KAH3827872.1 hypothetical protein DPMN_129815 [Dreissena polymorpha]